MKHEGPLTLDHLFTLTQRSFECMVMFIKEKPSFVNLQPWKNDEDKWVEIYTNHSPFPSFHPSQIRVPYDDPEDAYDTCPEKVFVGPLPLIYKPFSSLNGSTREIEQHSKIAKSGHSAGDLRTLRM
jgi:hypothetical protein